MAVRNDFTAGEVLAAADLNDTFASKVDYATPTNAQSGTAYTFVAADAEKLTTASNGSAVTLTIPPQASVTWSDNTVLRVVNYGAGAVTIDGGSGVTVTNTSSTIAQYGAAVAIRTGSDAWTVVPFGGGDVPSATVSSPAATGQYTDSGITYDYYTFTASGTLTVDTAGFADVLIVGGGGGTGYGGGGGAGGHLYITDAFLPVGSQTVTVGAGGSSSEFFGANGSSSRLASYFAVGGGAGAYRDGGVTGNATGLSGGSGGGGSQTGLGGAGVATQGNNGGTGGGSGTAAGGGGGGAGAVGSNATAGAGGAGGAGTANSITGSSVTRAGGGGGGGSSSGGAGGSGGGGAGNTAAGSSGTVNTGGGAGGGWASIPTGNGGSGVVIVRVKV